MNDNNKEKQAAYESLRLILSDLQRLESLHELIRANDCAGFMSLSRHQQQDILDTAGDLSLDVRCRFAAELPSPQP